MPAMGVLTPLAWLTAERVKAPQVGMALKNEPAKLHRPKVNISCEAFNWSFLTTNEKQFINEIFSLTHLCDNKLTKSFGYGHISQNSYHGHHKYGAAQIT